MRNWKSRCWIPRRRWEACGPNWFGKKLFENRPAIDIFTKGHYKVVKFSMKICGLQGHFFQELSVDVSEFVSLPSDALLAARVSRIEDYGIFVLVRPPSGGAPVQGWEVFLSHGNQQNEILSSK